MFQNALAINMHDGNAMLAARTCDGAGFLLSKYYVRRSRDNHFVFSFSRISG